MKSKLAITGFILSLIPIFLYFIMRPKWQLAGESGMRYLFYTIFIALIISLISFIISIVSWFQIKNYKLEGEWFAILGYMISLFFYPVIIFLESFIL